MERTLDARCEKAPRNLVLFCENECSETEADGTIIFVLIEPTQIMVVKK